MLNLIKSLFCNHKYEHHLVGEEVVTPTMTVYKYMVAVCVHCGKAKVSK